MTRFMGSAAMRSLKTLLGAGVLAISLSACGADSEVGNGVVPCSSDAECGFGSVCLAKGECGTAPCDFCSAGQVCVTLESGEQTCSVPECDSSADCEGEEQCIAGLCTESTCSTKDDCPAGKICNQLTSACVDPPEACASDAQCPGGEVCITDMGVCVIGCPDDASCGAGQICDQSTRVCITGCRSDENCPEGQTCGADNKCVAGQPTTCADVSCDATQRCNPNTLQCDDVCTSDAGQPNSCPAGQVCNGATGACEQDGCPGQDPNQCDGNAVSPYWSTTLCACVECLDSTQCGGGEQCNSNGQCTGACTVACDPSVAGTCGTGDAASLPYCIANCCVECISAADCAGNDICLDGFCGAQPDCSADPNACPAGLTCQGGQCVPAGGNGGGSCDPNDPTSCPTGQFCQPDMNGGGTCGGLGGGAGCGLCNDDCTCDGGLTCNGFLCEGCSGPFCDPSNPLAGVCLGGICLPLGL